MGLGVGLAHSVRWRSQALPDILSYIYYTHIFVSGKVKRGQRYVKMNPVTGDFVNKLAKTTIANYVSKINTTITQNSPTK